MSSEIATREQSAGSLAAILSDPERLQAIPVETVERLWAIDREIRAERARQQFAQAMNDVQGRMEPVRKLARNAQTGSMYARAEDVDQMLSPLLAGAGLSVSCSTVEPVVADHMRICMMIRHVGGHEERHYLDAPVDDRGIKGSPTKTRLHGMGSTMTYCRRYLLCQVFGVQLTADTDGNRPDDAATVSDGQAADIEALLEEVRADRGRFLRYFGIQQVADLPARRHREAVRMLEAKRP